jgi:hypothetical protein
MEQPTEGAAAVDEQPLTENAAIEHRDDSVEAGIDPGLMSDVPSGVDAAENEGLPPATAESHEVPIHRVVCMVDGCKCGATYRPTASGIGLMILERYGMDIDQVLGIGESGRPECPKGHGEMTFADEQLPIEQAINQVHARVEQAKARPLPFPAPAFNYEGAFHEIVEKRHEVADLESRHEDKKAAAKKAKEALDEANLDLGKMIEEFEKREDERKYEIARRLRQAEEGHPDGTTLLRCLYEQQYPDDLCPLCTGDRALVIKFLGHEIAARDASAHVDQVVEYRTKLDVEETEDALQAVIARVHLATIAEWTTEERAAVRVWAFQTVDHETNGAKTAPPPRPAVLGPSHIAATVEEDAKVQSCTACGAVLQVLDGDDGPCAFLPGSQVWLDCPGATAEVTNRYPDTKGKKKAAPRKAAASPKPTAAKKSARRKK